MVFSWQILTIFFKITDITMSYFAIVWKYIASMLVIGQQTLILNEYIIFKEELIMEAQIVST